MPVRQAMKTELLENKSVKELAIIKIKDHDSFYSTDELAVEEPLEIRVSYLNGKDKVSKNLAVTMRTPGNDVALAIGFLFTEGIISNFRQIKNVGHLTTDCSNAATNTLLVEFSGDFIPQLMKSDRNFYTTSSCGVCGKGSIESIRTVSAFGRLKKEVQAVSLETLYQLPEKLRVSQANFSATGGIHASGLFSLNGTLVALHEDVGRHNALDKLIGHALMTELVPLSSKILVLSGRASFELIQKAAMAGIATVAAIGAPSSLAVDLAKEFDITLLGFLRDNRLNIYHSGSHFKIEDKI